MVAMRPWKFCTVKIKIKAKAKAKAEAEKIKLSTALRKFVAKRGRGCPQGAFGSAKPPLGLVGNMA